jgi:hypothetical protein
MIAVLYQPAAEYVGVLLKGIPAALGKAVNVVADFAGEHTAGVVGGLAVLIVLWAFLARGRRL